jgi:hypothetical protein
MTKMLSGCYGRTHVATADTECLPVWGTGWPLIKPFDALSLSHPAVANCRQHHSLPHHLPHHGDFKQQQLLLLILYDEVLSLLYRDVPCRSCRADRGECLIQPCAQSHDYRQRCALRRVPAGLLYDVNDAAAAGTAPSSGS